MVSVLSSVTSTPISKDTLTDKTNVSYVMLTAEHAQVPILTTVRAALTTYSSPVKTLVLPLVVPENTPT